MRGAIPDRSSAETRRGRTWWPRDTSPCTAPERPGGAPAGHRRSTATVERVSDGLVTSALTMQMLEWIGEGPRSYAETLEAWKTSCPRLTIWEDAVADGFVRVERGAVTLTSAGRSRVLGLA